MWHIYLNKILVCRSKLHFKKRQFKVLLQIDSIILG